MTKSHSDEAAAHEAAMIAAFAEVVKAEETLGHAKGKLTEATTLLGNAVRGAETQLENAWAGVQALLAETGEIEVVLPGAVTDYKICYSTPRESVKVENADAVPDEYVKLERKPKLKEIGEHLKGLRDGNLPAPNWARLELSEKKLGWKAVKKGSATTEETTPCQAV